MAELQAKLAKYEAENSKLGAESVSICPYHIHPRWKPPTLFQTPDRGPRMQTKIKKELQAFLRLNSEVLKVRWWCTPFLLASTRSLLPAPYCSGPSPVSLMLLSHPGR